MGQDGKFTPRYFFGPDIEMADTDIEGLIVPSDRAAAIICQAMLEDTIRVSIASMLYGERQPKEALLGDAERAGALGFSDQCRLAYGLGIVDDDQLSDLLLIGRIRNRFGHSPATIAFSDRSIRDRCKSLKTYKGFRRLVRGHQRAIMSEPRETYTRCALALTRSIIKTVKHYHMGELRRCRSQEAALKRRLKSLAKKDNAAAHAPRGRRPK